MKNLEEIKKVLPHRYPFLLIDRLLEVREGEYCRALKNISGNEEIFQGHFPQKAVFPGVMIIEALVHHLLQWELLLLQTVVLVGGGTCIWLMIATAPKDLVDLEEEVREVGVEQVEEVVIQEEEQILIMVGQVVAVPIIQELINLTLLVQTVVMEK